MPISINDLSETALARLHASLAAWDSWGAHPLQQDAALVGRRITRGQAEHLAKRLEEAGADVADVPLSAFVRMLDQAGTQKGWNSHDRKAIQALCNSVEENNFVLKRTREIIKILESARDAL